MAVIDDILLPEASPARQAEEKGKEEDSRMATMGLNTSTATKTAQGRTTFGSSSGGFLLRNTPTGVKLAPATLRTGPRAFEATGRSRG